jgi:fatty acid desaturase
MPQAKPVKLNLVLVTLFLAVNAWQFLILPLCLGPGRAWLMLTLIPPAFLSNSLWFLMHEAVHNNLADGPRTNERLGGLLAVTFGAPFDVLRFGHLMHHRFNGERFDRPDLYDPERQSPVVARVRYYANILGGLYAGELASFFVFFLPKPMMRAVLGRVFRNPAGEAERKLGEQAHRVLLADRAVFRARIQGAAFFSLLTLSMILYGELWFVPLVILALRGFFISFANNLPHYGESGQDSGAALNLKLPRWAHAFYLHFYHHRAHHEKPLVPWTALPESFARMNMGFDRPFLAAALAQLKGPIAYRFKEN